MHQVKNFAQQLLTAVQTVTAPLIVLIVMLGFTSCVRAPLELPANSMSLSSMPDLADDLNYSDLSGALQRQLSFLAALPAERQINFGETAITLGRYRKSLADLQTFLGGNKTPEEIAAYLSEHFDFYQVYGRDDWGEVLVSAYYEPVIPGSLVPTDLFQQPLYRTPADMLTLDLSRFDPKYVPDRKLRARLNGTALLPYYTRAEIDAQGVLAGRGLEICWVDPVDAFFLQIQGSGVVQLEHGAEITLNFAEKNGHPYRSLGPLIKEKLPEGPLSADIIEEYLHSLPRSEQQDLLNLNPSYVFFKRSDKNAVTASGIPATVGRTIATDARFFPKGTLAFLEFDRPVLPPGATIPTETERVSRFVLDQDTGGAITGGGRVDLFWGRGAAARPFAGRVRSIGHLWYLVPKE